MSDNEDNFDGDDFDDVEEDEGLDDLENAEEEGQENVEILPSGERPQANQKRITTPYMTKYERARVLGTRALQIAWLQRLVLCRSEARISDPLPGLPCGCRVPRLWAILAYSLRPQAGSWMGSRATGIRISALMGPWRVQSEDFSR
ncbi:DNA-directed RNA polymerases I, II, and III subunit RPABC2 isoform X1 [Ochotona princeps]|uniref:DNA-directed RNA polymerases I, II, and III subunit RPABC2 isoform X1 n=1 Tax=Ochotona princeps TaxID=9978 RepID=UPI002714FE3D|nr:DNA-directed RNA polymerases I, II, and III subunit RPABC2 isoform X1 [Ochotona princeps]